MLVTQSCLILCDPMDCSPPGSSVMGFCSKNTGVGCHFLLQGIFLAKGSNLCLLNWQAASLFLCHHGNSSCLWSWLIMTAGRSWNHRTPSKQSSNPLQTSQVRMLVWKRVTCHFILCPWLKAAKITPLFPTPAQGHPAIFLGGASGHNRAR